MATDKNENPGRVPFFPTVVLGLPIFGRINVVRSLSLSVKFGRYYTKHVLKFIYRLPKVGKNFNDCQLK